MTWEPTRWWRAVDAEGNLWCESSNEAEVREAARPGDRVERLWREVKEEWRPVFATGGVVRAGSPAYDTVPFPIGCDYVIRPYSEQGTRPQVPCCDEACLGCGAGCWLLLGHKHDGRGNSHECGVCWAKWGA